MAEAINVQVIMQEIRERVREQAAYQEPKPLRAFPSGPQLSDLSDLEIVSRDLRGKQAAIGEMPPEPPTLRGRVGSLLVRMVRRALFWQTQQLREFHADVVEGYDQQLAALKTVVAENRQSRQLTQDLWTQVAELSGEIERINRALRAQQAANKRLLNTMIGVESQSRRALEIRLDLESELLENLSERLTAQMAGEAAAREELGRRVDAEVAAREVLQQALTAEASAREELGRRVDAEVVAREVLQQALTAEAGAREELGRRVDAEVATRDWLQQALVAEAGAREELGRRVDAEVATRDWLQQALVAEAGAREELGRRVDGEVATRDWLQQALTAEAGAREELARRADAEVATREWLQQALKAEAGAREELGRRVDGEVATREWLQQALKAEAGAREELGRRVDAEVATREWLQQALKAEAGAREELARRADAEVATRDWMLQALKAEAGAREELARRADAEVATRDWMLQALKAEAGAREELARRADAEAAAREALQHGLGAEMRAREEVARRVEAEIAMREGLQQALGAEAGAREELGRRVEAEAATREWLQQALGAETGAREQLAVAVAENLRAHQKLETNYRGTDRALHGLRADLSTQGTRVSTLLVEARKRLPKDFNTAQLAKIADLDGHIVDSLYLALEDRFRGSREEIKERMRYYLPVLQKEHIGVRRMPVLDIGCGRGEWLELLSESGLEARGVDTNGIFVTECKEKGLNVTQEDALEHLRTLPDASVGAVTGFHIIEHLPLDTLVKLVDETIRVLKPGGIAIFETPNPQNVLVGCHNFYIDPTHRHPIPGLLAQFILETRGLCNVEIIQLHPYPESFNVRDGGGQLAQRFNEYFYGPQDYAVIGRRV